MLAYEEIPFRVEQELTLYWVIILNSMQFWLIHEFAVLKSR